jgi:hypothetical protein
MQGVSNQEPMQLVLRHANVSRKGGHWNDDDFDVFAGDQDVGRILRLIMRRDESGASYTIL